MLDCYHHHCSCFPSGLMLLSCKLIVKRWIYPCAISWRHVEEAGLYRHSLLTLAVARGEWSALAALHHVPSTHWVGDWVGCTPSVDILQEKEALYFHACIQPGLSSLWCNYYSNYWLQCFVTSSFFWVILWQILSRRLGGLHTQCGHFGGKGSPIFPCMYPTWIIQPVV